MNKYNSKFVNFLIGDQSQFLHRTVDFLSEYLSPEDIFDHEILSDWALKNGFVKAKRKKHNKKHIV